MSKEIDVHGQNRFEAEDQIERELIGSGGNLESFILVHGYHMGTILRDYFRHGSFIWKEKAEATMNPGETRIILKKNYYQLLIKRR